MLAGTFILSSVVPYSLDHASNFKLRAGLFFNRFFSLTAFVNLAFFKKRCFEQFPTFLCTIMYYTSTDAAFVFYGT